MEMFKMKRCIELVMGYATSTRRAAVVQSRTN